MKIIRQFFSFLKKWFWKNPTEHRIKAKDINDQYKVIQYNGQRINLHKVNELPAWGSLPRRKKREIATNWRLMEKKKHITFQEIDGKLICIKNANYEQRAENARQSRKG